MMSRLLLFYIILSIVNGLTMTVKSGKETCIWETGKAGDQLYDEYEVNKSKREEYVTSSSLLMNSIESR